MSTDDGSVHRLRAAQWIYHRDMDIGRASLGIPRYHTGPPLHSGTVPAAVYARTPTTALASEIRLTSLSPCCFNPYQRKKSEYGSVLLKKTETADELIIEPVKWDHTVVDPRDIAGGPKIDRHYLTALDLKKKADVWTEVDDQARQAHCVPLSTWSLERRGRYWHIVKPAFLTDPAAINGPYSSVMSHDITSAGL